MLAHSILRLFMCGITIRSVNCFLSWFFCFKKILLLQREIALKVIAELQRILDQTKAITSYHGKKVVTIVTDATEFFPAHLEHQEYLDKNPSGECNHRYR
jgi:peptide methionine sulfoxide reductase MsrA